MDAKKKTIKAAEQDRLVRIGWSIFLRFIDACKCVFVDETSATTTMTRQYARAPYNERAVDRVPRNYGTATTLIGALSLAGLGAVMTVGGAVDEDVMVVYVREVLCPTLRPGQIVFMDNLSSHKGKTVRALIEQAGCSLIFLPPIFARVLAHRAGILQNEGVPASDWGADARRAGCSHNGSYRAGDRGRRLSLVHTLWLPSTC